MKEVQVVGAVIYDEEQGFLCALRGEKMSLAGYWEFPGGKVELGENHKEALMREIQEELSCSVLVEEPIVSTTHDYGNVRVHLHTYFATLDKGTPIAKEHETLKWVLPQDLESLNWAPADIPTVEKLLQGKEFIK